MSQDDFSNHHTITTRILGGDGEGWEFACETCGYHARYTLGGEHSQGRLEVLDAGDPLVRHASYSPRQASVDPCSEAAEPGYEESAATAIDEQYEFAEDEAWLTPELRRTLESILDRLDD